MAGMGVSCQHAASVLCKLGRVLALQLTPRNASSRLDLPSLCPPMATISGMGKDSPMATEVDCSRLHTKK